MKPSAFSYAAPLSMDECLSLKAAHGEDARFIAGGQSLMPLMNLRMLRPSVVIDLRRVPDLSRWRRDGDTVAIGPLLRQRALEHDSGLAAHLPVLAEAVLQIGHPTTRNRGTIVGSLCHADPAAEIPVCAVLLRGEVVLASRSGRRTLPVADFVDGALSTSIGDDELVEELRLPVAAPRTGYAFLEIARRHGDFALVSVAVSVSIAEDGRIGHARAAIGGLGDAPSGVDIDELAGAAPGRVAAFADAGRRIAATLDPPTDLHATAAYRRAIAGILVERALASATARAVSRSTQ